MPDVPIWLQWAVVVVAPILLAMDIRDLFSRVPDKRSDDDG